MYSIKQIKFTQPNKFRLATADEFGFFLTSRGISTISDLGSVGADDLLIFKPNQVLELEYTGGRVPLIAIWLRITTLRMQSCSSEQTDLSASSSKDCRLQTSPPWQCFSATISRASVSRVRI